MITKVHFRGFHRFKENVFDLDEMMCLISSSELSVGEWVLVGVAASMMSSATTMRMAETVNGVE